jgi:hypothetical protein
VQPIAPEINRNVKMLKLKIQNCLFENLENKNCNFFKNEVE